MNVVPSIIVHGIYVKFMNPLVSCTSTIIKCTDHIWHTSSLCSYSNTIFKGSASYCKLSQMKVARVTT